jgi:DNA-binding CsgD family transcriptional regulator
MGSSKLRASSELSEIDTISVLAPASELASRLISYGLGYIGLGYLDGDRSIGDFNVGSVFFYYRNGICSWINQDFQGSFDKISAKEKQIIWIDGSDNWISRLFVQHVEFVMHGRGLNTAAVIPLLDINRPLSLVLATDLEPQVLAGVLNDAGSAINLAVSDFVRNLSDQHVLVPGGEIHLTAREVGVLTLTARGKTRDEAAVVLHISPLTVKDHLQRAGRKLKASNKTHAVARAMVMGLISV